ncbi:MAG: hypothetical protein ACRDFB_09065 [Rhabdochlamydiaceae bacterium]
MLKIDFPIRIGQIACSFLNQPKLPTVFGFSENNNSFYTAYKIAALFSPILVLFRPKWDSQIIATAIRVIPTFAQKLIHRWNPEQLVPTNEDLVGVVGEVVFSLAYVSSIANPLLLKSEKTVRVALYMLGSILMSLPLIRHYVEELSNKIHTSTSHAPADTATVQYSGNLTIINETVQHVLEGQITRFINIDNCNIKLESYKELENCTKLEAFKSSQKNFNGSHNSKKQTPQPPELKNLIKEAKQIKYSLDYLQKNVNSLSQGNILLKTSIKNIESLHMEDLLDNNQALNNFITNINTVNKPEYLQALNELLTAVTTLHHSFTKYLGDLKKANSADPSQFPSCPCTETNIDELIKKVTSFLDSYKIQKLPPLLSLDTITSIQESLQNRKVTLNLGQFVEDMRMQQFIVAQRMQASMLWLSQQQEDLYSLTLQNK